MTEKKRKSSPPNTQPYRRLSAEDLYPVDELIPYNRRFLGLGQQADSEFEQKGISPMKKFGSNMKGLFGSFRIKEMERPEIIRLRNLVGDLKEAKVAGSIIPALAVTSALSDPTQPKTKRELLEEKRKSIQLKAKEPKRDKNQIGLRIEIDRLKKRYPTDGNLVIMDAILTTRDSCLPHRSIEERVASLLAALRESGRVVSSSFLTTFSVDVLFDIYFLYLETLKKLFLERMRKQGAATGQKNATTIKSLKRDIQVLNILLNQVKLKKTVSNVAQKLNGFGYPFINMSDMDVSKTFSADKGSENDKQGPGTIKLNKFLVRIYMNVFSQVPIFQPIASRIANVLPNDYQCKVIAANGNIDSAYMQLKISKAMNADTVEKQSLALFYYGRQFIRSTIKKNATTPSEGRILLRTAEMAEEYSFISNKIDPEILKFGYHAATMALSFFQPEAEAIIRRLFEIADAKKVDLRVSSSEPE